MDLTLYSNPEYGQYQIDCLIGKLGERQGKAFPEMKSEVEEAGKTWALSHDGKKPCLSEILSGFGISMEENVRWRNELYKPEKYLCRNEKLRETLQDLSRFFVLGVITNNPVLMATRTLAVLGIDGFFPVLVGLDTCMKCKPNLEPFFKFAGLSECSPETCVSVGDRYDIDIRAPLEIGMGGILVDGVEDIYQLPNLLHNHL